MHRVPRHIVERTFEHFRQCGAGRHECQVLWLSPWDTPDRISEAVHPAHKAHAGGFVLDDQWLSEFWLRLARENIGIRVQVHTHPREAFHSHTDDAFPVIHTTGFLSLVIPNYALGPIGFEDAYLAEIQDDGLWRQVYVEDRLLIE